MNSIHLLLLLLLLQTTTAHISCSECKIIAADISKIASNNTKISDIVKLLETDYCDVQYKKKPLKKLACDAVAKGLGSVIKFAYKQIATLAWDSVNLCAVAGLCKIKCCNTDTIPEQLHLALTRDPNSMSIGWTTLNDTAKHTVQYGLSSSNLNNTNLNNPGTSSTYDHFGWLGHLHNAFMTNLKPNGTKYFYRVGDSNGGWSKTYSFYTMYTDVGSDAHPLVVASVGDMGYCNASTNTINSISKLIDDNKINFVIHNGDISYADGEYSHWDVFMRKIETIAARVPYMTTPGNHELYFNFSAYKHRFVMPDGGSNDGLYHGRVVGNTHFVGIDTEAWWDLPLINKRQLSWINNEFQSTTSTDQWKIAYGHRPVYASRTKTKQQYYLREKLETTFSKYGIDLVLQAHQHDYERTWPVTKNGTIFETNYSRPSYPVYIVNGAGGNREAEPTPPANMPWQPVQNKTNFISFGKMTIKKNSLQWEQIVSSDNSVQDAFTITK